MTLLAPSASKVYVDAQIAALEEQLARVKTGYYWPEDHGGTDILAAQTAADAIGAAGGGILKLTPNVTYLWDAPLRLHNNTIFEWEGAEIIRSNAQTATGIPNATIMNADQVFGNSNIRIKGAGQIGAQSSAAVGPHFGFYQVSNLWMDDFWLTSIYGDWNTKIRMCQFVIAHGYAIQDGFASTLNDGMHFVGGNDIVIGPGLLQTGDDSIAFSLGPAATSGSITYPETPYLTRIAVLPHTTRPSRSRNVNILIPSTVIGGGYIQGVAVGDILGAHDNPANPSGLSIRIEDASLLKNIMDVYVGRCVIDATNGAGSALTVKYVKHFTFDGEIIAPGAHGAAIDNVDDLKLRLKVRNGRAATQSAAVVTESTDLDLEVYGENTPQHTVVLGRSSDTVTFSVTVPPGGNLQVSDTTGWSPTGTILRAGGVTVPYSAIVDSTHVTLPTGGAFTAGEVIAANPCVDGEVKVVSHNGSLDVVQVNAATGIDFHHGKGRGNAHGIIEVAPSDWNTFSDNDMSGVGSQDLVVVGPNSIIKDGNRGIAGWIPRRVPGDVRPQNDRFLPDPNSFSNFYPGSATGSQAMPNAGDARWARIIMERDGTLHDLSALLASGGSTGNYRIGILDTGQAAGSAARTLKAISALTAVPASNWMIFDAALAVLAGQVFDVFIMFDTVTPKVSTANGATGTSTTPNSNFLTVPSPGTATGKLSGTIAAANVPTVVGATVTDGNMVQSPQVVLFEWRLA